MLLCTSAPLQAALQASVNRTQLEPEQTLELTLEAPWPAATISST
ncbi:hypothetical protein ULG90_05650 [Halopseudomonas pachastrellae]|nr:hypothetical protein ULG90_05650 [Halopseudomonas pachastrellae]